MEQHTMKVIARIRSDFPEKFGIPRQSGLVPELRSKIVFEPEFRNADALRGIEGFSANMPKYSSATSPRRSMSGKSLRIISCKRGTRLSTIVPNTAWNMTSLLAK